MAWPYDPAIPLEDNDLGGIKMFIHKDLCKDGHSTIYAMIKNGPVCHSPKLESLSTKEWINKPWDICVSICKYVYITHER